MDPTKEITQEPPAIPDWRNIPADKIAEMLVMKLRASGLHGADFSGTGFKVTVRVKS